MSQAGQTLQIQNYPQILRTRENFDLEDNYTITWFRGTMIIAEGDSYTLTDADIGHRIRAVISSPYCSNRISTNQITVARP